MSRARPALLLTVIAACLSAAPAGAQSDPATQLLQQFLYPQPQYGQQTGYQDRGLDRDQQRRAYERGYQDALEGRRYHGGYAEGYRDGYERGARERETIERNRHHGGGYGRAWWERNGRCDDERYETSNGGKAPPGADEYDCSRYGNGMKGRAAKEARQEAGAGKRWSKNGVCEDERYKEGRGYAPAGADEYDCSRVGGGLRRRYAD